MATRRKISSFSRGTLLGALLLCAFLLMNSAQVSAAPQYSMTCSSCHGMPPVDSATRDFATGGFKGNHQTHQPSGASIANCAICHNASGYTSGHMNGQISFQGNINSSPATSQYKISGSAITFKNQTSIPNLGNCSNANCHFETVTPTWGSANYSSTANCSACHASPGTSVGHSKHDTYFPFAANGCVKCHPDYVTGLKFNHATSAKNRGIKVALSEGSYSGTGLNYLPSQSASRTLGGCSSVYCHSPGDKASAYNAPNKAATWGTTLDCTGCHKLDVASGDAITSPATGYGHGKHVNSTLTTNIGCVKCHAATVSNNTTISSTADHTDKFVTIKFNSTTTAVNGTYNGQSASSVAYKKTPGSTTGTCQNVYCHSYGTASTGTFRVMSTARWGSALPGNCTGCHGGDGTSARFRIMSTGRHQKHMRGVVGVSYNYGCAECHSATVSSNTTISNPANHVNAKINVDIATKWGGTYSDNGHIPGVDTTRTCNNVYCHSNAQKGGAQVFRNLTGSKTWYGNSGSLGCSGCHGYKNSSILSGKHTAHMNNATVIGTNLDCSECHLKTRTASGWNDRNLHANKFADYSGIRAGGSARYTTATGVCSNVYCHSNGKGTFKSMTSSAWFSARTLDCKGCHGSEQTPGFVSVAGEPNYVSVGVGLATSNSHNKHVAVATDCYKCHAKTTQTGTSIISGAVDHIDGGIDARFSKLPFTNLSGAYNSSNKTCSATYCHGSGASPQWGATGTLNCTSCHSNMGAGTQATAFTGAHAKHSDWATSGKYSYACEQCHSNKAVAPFTPANHAGGAVSLNQAAEVVFYNGAFVNWTSTSYGDETSKNYKYRSLTVNPYGATQPTPTYAAGTAGTPDNGFVWTNGTCSNLWCHSNGNPVGGTNNFQASLSWNTTITCTSCHGSTGTVGGTGLSSIHGKHINTFAYTCDKCHANTVAAGSNSTLNATTGSQTHVNGMKNVNFDSFNPGSTYASLTCSTNYCHSDGKGTFASPKWDTVSTGACGTCHKVSAATTGGLINTKAHFAHFSTSANSYGPMYTQTNESKCSQCHTYTTETAATHINKTVDVTSNCTTSCHKQIAAGSITTAWAGGAVSCESCHTGTLSVINFTAPDKSTFGTYGHGKITAGMAGKNCVDCHDRNQRHITGKPLGYTNRVLVGLGNGDTRQACDYCHKDPAKVTNATFRNVSTHFMTQGGPANMTCQLCHDPHGNTTNIKMIVSSIKFINSTTWTISYTDSTTSMVNLVTNRGLCQVCHTKTNHYRAGVPETGHPTSNCYNCHAHNAKGGAFKADGTCDSCHGYPPVPRNVAVTFGRFNNWTSAKFEDYSGGGGAHVVDRHVAKTAKASDGWSANCTNCHSGGAAAHKMTLPLRSNVANVSVIPNPSFKRFNPAAQIAYTSAKLLNPPSRNQTGTCSNISCHFKPSPRWSTER